jgi:hypothetical protein
LWSPRRLKMLRPLSVITNLVPVITKNTSSLLEILVKQMSQKNLWILFPFCGGPVATARVVFPLQHRLFPKSGQHELKMCLFKVNSRTCFSALRNSRNELIGLYTCLGSFCTTCFACLSFSSAVFHFIGSEVLIAAVIWSSVFWCIMPRILLKAN